MQCWNVVFTRRAAKQAKALPDQIKRRLQALILEIEKAGPVRGNWSNYSKLEDGSHHCHLTYRYVACWRETIKGIQIEVYHVSTREKAPY
jgi:mRNA-degrading endonuclease RelE of RelBE toxin-antitoxin system